MLPPNLACRIACFSMVAGCLALPAASTAQQLGPVLAGTVYGMGGAPLEGADVLVVGRDERLMTGPDGRFRIAGLQPNRYVLLIRMPGYDPARIVAAMGEAGISDLEIFLNQLPYALDNIVVTGDRRGIHGVVLGPDRQPVIGAQVRILGGGVLQLSDSIGRFAFPDKHGATYVVRVTKEGFVSQPVHLRIPTGQSREVTIHLAERYPGYEAPFREDVHYFDLGQRLAWRSPLTRMAHDELDRFEGMRVCDIPKVKFSLHRAMQSVATGRAGVTTVVNGHLVLENIAPCFWLADEVALIELAVSCGKDGIGGTGFFAAARLPRVAASTRTVDRRSMIEGSCIALWLKGNAARVEVP